MCKVVNIKTFKGEYVYIGRPSKFGNPYTHLEYAKGTKFFCENREEAIKKYEEYLINNTKLMEDLPELRFKNLGCYCHPKPCHGNILKKYVDKLEADSTGLF